MTAQNLPSEPEFEQAYKGMCHLISTRHTANGKKNTTLPKPPIPHDDIVPYEVHFI